MTRTNQEVYQRRDALVVSGSQLVGVEGSGFFRGSGLFYLFVLGVVFWFGSQLIVVICFFLIRCEGFVVSLPWRYQALRLLWAKASACRL